jgi:uncharacterized protein (DUF1697 family)
MRRYVALFRGINVGGRHTLPMQELRQILASQGCANVRTYIQSGNAVFDTAVDPGALAAALVRQIGTRFGFEPSVLLLEAGRFRDIAAANPYPGAVTRPKTLQVCFLMQDPASPDLGTLRELRSGDEAFTLGKGALYLDAPDGIGRSKLAAKVEACLGVGTTSRNWNTVAKLLELID